MSLLDKVGRFAIVFVVLAILNTTSADNDYQVAGLKEHNKLRKLHGAPAMSLDSNLNAIAVKCANYYANKGKNDHSCPHRNKKLQGENLGYSFDSKGVSEKKGVVDAVNRWYNEIKDYNFNKPGFKKGTGHFTQVVWKASTKLGIGAAIRGKKIYVAAIYAPLGNFGKSNDYKSQVARKG